MPPEDDEAAASGRGEASADAGTADDTGAAEDTATADDAGAAATLATPAAPTDPPALDDLDVTVVSGGVDDLVGRETVVVAIPNADETRQPPTPWSREYRVRLGVVGATLAVDLAPAGLSAPARLLRLLLGPFDVADAEIPGCFGPPLPPVDARLREVVERDAVLAAVQSATETDDDRVDAGRCLVHASEPGIRTLHCRYDRSLVTCDGPVELPVRRLE
jgi:hypothetical protein